MFEDSLTIKRPFGVSVFGSGLIRIAPDLAWIRAAVYRINEKASVAFSETRQGVQTVVGFLRKFDGLEYGAARVKLAAEWRFVANERRFVGYRATVGINVQLRELERLEEISIGLVEAGANEIASIDFHSSELKQFRAQARVMAIEAAREKGLLYAQSAGVTLGKVIHIQDVNPQILNVQNQARGHGAAPAGPEADLENDTQSLDPSAIEVHAAVLAAYAID